MGSPANPTLMMNITAAELGPRRDNPANSDGTSAAEGPAVAISQHEAWIASLLYVSHQLARIDFRPIEVPIRVGSHPFRGAAGSRPGAFLCRHRVRDQRGDLAVIGIADPQAPLEAGILRRIGFGIGDVDDVVAVDEDAARPAELLPFRDEFPILVEDLDAIVGAVADEQPAARIHGKPVEHIELARARPLLALSLDEGAVLRELDDPSVGVA